LHTKSIISAQRGASRFSVLSLLVFAVGLSGCYRVVIDTPAQSSGVSGDDSGASFMGLTTVTANAQECRYGVARASTAMPFWGLVLQVVTAGIVTGMTAEYQCAAPPEHSATTDAAGVSL
jgi:hypothetical protein